MLNPDVAKMQVERFFGQVEAALRKFRVSRL
jgi:hypothetical protein